jgi:hypothetical protein
MFRAAGAPWVGDAPWCFETDQDCGARTWEVRGKDSIQPDTVHGGEERKDCAKHEHGHGGFKVLIAT